MYYRIAKVILYSQVTLPSFQNFIYEPEEKTSINAELKVTLSSELPPEGSEVISDYIAQRKTENGWFLHHAARKYSGLLVNPDYTEMRLVRNYPELVGLDLEHEKMPLSEEIEKAVEKLAAGSTEEGLIRMAIECYLARQGYVSLHSACIEMEGEAYAFSGPSGTGKSTRANAWMDAFEDAELVSGDRPLIDVRNLEVYGVPWDGKEQCYRNVHYPLKAIFEVRRMEADTVYIREMGFEQRRKLLLQQCFLPMWDTETAVIQMMNIAKLASSANILRAFCGRRPEDAAALKKVFDSNQYKKEEPDMKAKSGFVLRNIVGEKILMPTGDNIGKFKGTILMNDVSAFVWEKLQNPMSRNDLLAAILDEFEVEESVAAADLDALLAKLNEYEVIEND